MAKKIVLIVFGAIAVAGVVVAAIGIAWGGFPLGLNVRNGMVSYRSTRERVELGRFPFWNERMGNFNIFSFDGEDWDVGVSAPDGYDGDVRQIEAPFKKGDLKGVEVQIDAGYLIIEAGERWGLEIDGPLGVKSTYEEGVWRLEPELRRSGVYVLPDGTERPRFYLDGMDVTTEYTLTLPANFSRMEAGLSQGALEAEGFTLESLSLFTDVGILKAADCRAEKALFSVDAGAGEATDLVVKTCEIQVDVGEFAYQGEIESALDASCSLGNIRCALDEPEQYGYQVDVDMGSITIDGENHAYSETATSGNEGARPFYNLQCDLGEIDIIFQ